MSALRDRFDEVLKLATKGEGEDYHFESYPGQAEFTDRVVRWLSWLTPWTTPHTMGKGINPRNAPMLDRQAFVARRAKYPLELDQLLLNQFHTFLEPACFGSLTQSLGLHMSPAESQRVPQMCRCDDGHPHDYDGPPDSTFGPAEAAELEEMVRSARRGRDKATGKVFEVRVDGVPNEVFVGWQTINRIPLPRYATAVQVYAKEPDGDVLLATHLLDHGVDGEVVPSAGKIRLGARYRFVFEVEVDPTGDHASCSISCRPAFWVAPRIPIWPSAVPAVLTAFCICLFVYSLRQNEILRLKSEQLSQVQKSAREAALHSAELERQLSRLGDQRRQVRSPNGRVASEGAANSGSPQIKVSPLAADADLVVDLKLGALGAGSSEARIIPLSVPIPRVRVAFELPEVRAGAVIDVTVDDGDEPIQIFGLGVVKSGAATRVYMPLTSENVRRLINRAAKVSIVDRDHALIRSCILTLRLL